MALLTGVAQATNGSGPQGDAGAPGTDFLGALLAAAPVAPTEVAAESPLPLATGTAAAPADHATAAELAALIATLLPVAATDAASAPAPASVETTEGMQTAPPQAAATSSAAQALEQLLQRLAAEAGGPGSGNRGEQEQGGPPVPTATPTASVTAAAPAPVTAVATTAAATQPPADGLQQLLRAMAPRTATAEPPPAAKTGNTRAAASRFALPQAATDTANATDAAPPAPESAVRPAAVDAQPARFTLPATETQATAPAPAQSPAPAQAQQQAAALAQTPQLQQLPPAATHTVHNPVGSPRWADELGSRMMLMTVRGQYEGSLNLTPEHLGPMEVRVSVNQGTANVWFGAQHADTRAALTEAMPRLRELFADAGLVLGHAGVSQEAPRQQPRSSESERLAGTAALRGVEEADGEAPVARRVTLGLVDTYA